MQTGSSSKDYISLTLPKLTVDSVLAPPEDAGLLGTGSFSITTTFEVAAGYSIHSVSDFTDDTNDDILFSNSGTGSANLWMSNGDGTMTSSATVTFGAGYSPLGI